MFLPQKILQIKMILKAACTEDAENDFKRAISMHKEAITQKLD
jgi:hypothetical protein